MICPTTPPAQSLQAWHVDGLGSSLFARHYWGNHFYFLFLELLRCVSSLRWLFPPYIFRWKYLEINLGGLPHSETPGSKVICTYPRIIAAYHVLHRLHVPRHPPYTLSSFTKVLFLKMTWLHWITGLGDSIFPISKLSKNKIFILWSWQGSNLRPPECKSGALPTELQPQMLIPPTTKV